MKTAITQSKNGFTLIEILFAMSILLIVVAGVLPMYVQSSKVLMTADSKLDVNDEIRDITDEIINEAREADAFILYDNYQGAWIDGDFVNFRNSNYHGMGRLRDGESGRFLLLLFYGVDPYPDDSDPAPIDEMIGIYLDAGESADTGPIRIFSTTSINDALELEDNIPTIAQSSNHEIIMDEMTGKMNGDIFYNFGGVSIVVNGRISHTNGAKNETNLYNFTITPR